MAETVKVVTADEREFLVDPEDLKCSETIQQFLSEGHGEEVRAAVKGTVFEKALQYCREKRLHPPEPVPEADKYRTDNISPFDLEYMKDIGNEMLFGLLLGANYLDIKPLVDLCLKTIANMMKGKNAEEIKNLFKMSDDSQLAGAVRPAA